MAKTRRLVSFKDLQIKILCGGVAALDGIKDTFSRQTVRTTIKEFLKVGKATEAAELETWYFANYGALTRGRGAPVVGETRTYKAQTIREGGPFLRLPLDSLGIAKGAEVKASFENGEIRIKAA